jgi:hypothetical protein
MWRLPRWALWGLCLLYTCAGLVFRDPWKSADMIALGWMQAIAEGRSSWLKPVLDGYAAPAFSWLPYWLGALGIKLGAWAMPLDMAARLPFVGLLLLTFVAVWYATYCLAREPEAQPLPFALGGEAQPVDYARSVADGSVLALMATLGLAQLGHEATAVLARLACCALWLYAVAGLRLYPRKALWAGAAASFGLAFSGAPGLLLLLALVVFGLRYVVQAEFGLATRRTHGALVGLAILCAAGAWSLQAGLNSATYANEAWWAGLQFTGRSLSSWLRLFAWFIWPTGVMALVGLWAWRAWWRSAHIVWPIGVLVPCLLLVFAKAPADRQLLLATPALAVLAAMYLPTMRRTVSALVDWFTLSFFSICVLTIWVVWLSLQTGWPAQPARNVARLLPGLSYQGNVWATLVALLLTILWLRSIVWRVGRDRSALWKSLAIPAGGAAVCWALLMSLWFPLLNYARGYQNMMVELAQKTQAPTLSQRTSALEKHTAAHCLYASGLTPEYTAALHFYRPLPVQVYRRGQVQGQRCAWFVLEGKYMGRLPDLVGEQLWELHGTIQRQGDEDYLALYHRTAL